MTLSAATSLPLPAVAVIGTGIMGSAISRRLLDAGHRVSVYDRDAEKVAALVAFGAHGAASAADAVSASEYVITSLNSAAIVEAAVFGPGGVVEAASAERLLIDMSSIDPPSTRRLAQQLRDASG